MRKKVKDKIQNITIGILTSSIFVITSFFLYEFYQNSKPRYYKPNYNKISNYYKGDMKKVPGYYKGDMSKLKNYYKGDVTKSPNYYIPKEEREKRLKKADKLRRGLESVKNSL